MTSGNTAEVGPMFRITEKISRIIKKVLATESSTITESLRRSLNELSLSISDPDKGTTTRTISFGTIQELVGYLKKQRAGSGGGEVDKNSTYLHEILEGSEIVVQAPQKREPHPELVERRKKLQILADEMEYQRSVKHLEGKKRFGHEGAPLDIQDGKRVFSLVVSLLLTMGACFLFGWVAVGSITSNVVMKTLSGVISMLVAVGAELYFLMRSSLLTPKVKTHVD